MNEFSTSAKFIVWIVSLIVGLGLVGTLRRITYNVAVAAAAAQSQPMSYGDFSRRLWGQGK